VEFWQDRTALITGAGGFLGSRLTEGLLRRGAKVVALIRPGSVALRSVEASRRLQVVEGDVTDFARMAQVVREYGVGHVFHLAGQAVVDVGMRHPLTTLETNIRGTCNILEACRESSPRVSVVIASSDRAYRRDDVSSFAETTPLQGGNPYDVSKACADLIAQSYATAFNLPVAIARCSCLYGPGDVNASRLIPGVIQSAAAGVAPIIRSDGTPRCDYLYVEDAVRGFLALAETLWATPSLRGEPFNFGSGVGTPVLDVVRSILTLMNSGLNPVVLGSSRRDTQHRMLCTDKARRELGWAPSISFEQGLCRTISWHLTRENSQATPAGVERRVALS